MEELPEIRWKIVASNMNGMAHFPAFDTVVGCHRKESLSALCSIHVALHCSRSPIDEKYFEELLCFLAMYNLSNKMNSIISKRHMKS